MAGEPLTPGDLEVLLEVLRLSHLLAVVTFERDLYASGAVGSTVSYPDEHRDHPCRKNGHEPKNCPARNV